MLSYDLSGENCTMYEALYRHLKKDIKGGLIKVGEKLPSKRTLADNLGVSSITVENAYNLLADEGYIYSLPKKGYFVSDLKNISSFNEEQKVTLNINLPKKSDVFFDFSSNRTDAENFPFSIWAKLMRENMSIKEEALMQVSPAGGVRELREAIAKHLSSFRGMNIDPNQIVLGAGTEYLYGLLIKLLGDDKVYAVENPGYRKITQIYESSGVKVCRVEMDDSGVKVSQLRTKKAEIAHISPTHHFPTGITMPVKRRREMLEWADEEEGRYIIEDDYDSEFRLKGKPIPPLMNMDENGKVIYINTFSKSLASTIRISYMVLPEKLANEFYQRLYFYSNTISTFEQYTLAEFISRGYFEKHINRMRLHYGRRRKEILDIISETFDESELRVIENDSGLHFILELSTLRSDREIEESLLEKGINISAVSDFEVSAQNADSHRFILNYSGLDIEGLKPALKILKTVM